ncbi:MAG: hypothetical protein ACYTG3_09785 [Planctomycetota bacterium]|jgi:predicted nuclease of predicted toxin-antitoxin system
MRVLFDQGTPAPLRRSLQEHEVSTVHERGWSELTNGELLDAAVREGYEVLVTTDSNLRPAAIDAIRSAAPGRCTEVDIP